MAIFVSQIHPYRLLTGQSREITVMGSGFSGTVTVIINGINIPAFFVIGNTVKFLLPYIAAGTYDISVVNGDGASWTSRKALEITDPPAGVLGDLGSVKRPIVLPPVTIEQSDTAKVTPAVNYRRFGSPAKATYDTSTGKITAKLTSDMSYLPSEAVVVPDSQDSPSKGQVLETPWGTFKNE